MASEGDMIKKTVQFLQEDIWSTPQRDLTPGRARWIRWLKVMILSVRGFGEDKCRLHASALSLFTLLSIVPVVAMAFGIAKGFGFEELLERQILEQLPEQQAILQQVMGFAKSLLANTKGGVVAGIGIVVLFWSVIKVIGYIEESFNHIWRVKKARTMARKFSDYLSLMLIGPVLMIVSGSATVFIRTQLNAFGPGSGIPLSEAISSLALFLMGLVPLGSLWLLFSFLYLFIPNTKVSISSGALAGIVAGTIYYLVQLAYVGLQVGVARYNAIYGSFAALPLFLVWLQLSWFIVLFGAEFSYYQQTLKAYEYYPAALRISNALKKIVALLLVHRVVKRFCSGEKPVTAAELATGLGLPIQLTAQLIDELKEAGLIAPVQLDENRTPGFQPARDPGSISIGSVIDGLELRGCNRLPIVSSKEFDLFSGALATFREEVNRSPGNRLLKEI